MKTVTLKPRMPGEDGQPTWHDYYIISNALAAIAKGKSMAKMSPWINIAAKMQLAAEEIGISQKNLPPFSFEMGNVEAHLFWTELEKVPAEAFGALHPATGQQMVPNVGTLQIMRIEIAKELGEVVPKTDDDEGEHDQEK